MTMWRWPLLRWVVAGTATVASALVVGIPTGIIATPWYVRMTPVLWWNYPVWAATAVVSGLIVATYLRTGAYSCRAPEVGLGGNVLSLLAVGCPVCNKLVVMAVGASGAVTLWAPVQPVLGFGALGLLAWALRQRLRGERACPVPPPAVAETVQP